MSGDPLRDRLDALVLRRTANASAAPPPHIRPPTAIHAPTDAAAALGGASVATPRGDCWQVSTAVAADVHVAEPTLVLDIETGGFSGTPVFLIGVVALHTRPVTIVQWLARDYPEEAAILSALGELTSTAAGNAPPRWTTFNGRAFDEPFLRDRALVNRVAFQSPPAHIDLLPLARKRWRGELPDCKLATLEREILGRTRIGDIPGSDVPDLFHHFIRTGNARPLAGVLEHNRLDLLASAELLKLLT